ncbi:CGNR zinc finger domain-containing protein [Pseudonocardia spinosispora]|uniref:CGNR zinc finger domain-containing protein n=1 Tax=Pseudonocardia spinosispora TaxID=103441 RepID=UPI00068484AC|nr:CGNR zinc finger domain-containing protein [Pseudonocardia spinosispora]
MSDLASARFGIAPAPAGLVLVQELLNTVPVVSSPDLLDEPPTAQNWLDQAVALWAEQTGTEPTRIPLGRDDLDALRVLRSQLKRIVAGEPDVEAPAAHGALRLALSGDGRLTSSPDGDGAAWVVSAVLGEIYLAHQHDTWRRLKSCRNGTCGTVFFDRSRNNSGVWHDVHVCGNAANLRASRARRKQREQV